MRRTPDRSGFGSGDLARCRPNTINSLPTLPSGRCPPGGTCPMNLDVLEQVRQAVSDAQTAGEPAPGRPTLVKLTGATDYQVRKALAALANDEDSPAVASAGDGGESEPPALPWPTPTGRLPRPWPLIFIGLAAAVAIWGGWVRLGELTGFGPI